ncbi:MAG: rod shape-determining protein [Eubacteriales bacterium]|nr:rod shape-determining protein [Eubacteriales bacterium]
MFSFFKKGIGVDLGTTNVLVYVEGRGIVLREPSVVAVDASNRRQVLAVGEDARQMLGRTPGNIIAVQPMRDGVIADFETTETMMRVFIQKALGNRGSMLGTAPQAILCVPCDVTEVEERAVLDVARRAGAREACIAEEPLAAAIGAGLPVGEPMGSMVVDIGGGTTEVAVLSLGSIVVGSSLRVGGMRLDDSVVNYVKREYNILIGDRTAEDIKINLGSSIEPKVNTRMQIKGRNLSNGLPVTIEISSDQVWEALREPVSMIVDLIKSTLEKTPPELSADIMQRGIMLTGGGALLPGLDVLVYRQTGIPTMVAENPLDCVALGAGHMLEHFDTLKRAQKYRMTGATQQS